MTSTLNPILSSINEHVRDKELLFEEATHKYTIITDPDSKYTSVTTLNHKHFAEFDADKIIKNMMKGKKWNPENKYWGMTPAEIKAQWSENASSVSKAGTDLHFDIECFMNQPISPEKEYTHKTLLEYYEAERKEGFPAPNDSEEWEFFLQYIRASPHLKPYRTEWTIFDEELKIAGSIDMVYENPDGTLSIYDWKRAKDISKTNAFKKYAITECIQHLPDTNYWHYSLQLNTYKAIIERKYNKKVTDLYLVRLHPDNPKKTFELIKCANLSQELIELFAERKIQITTH